MCFRRIAARRNGNFDSESSVLRRIVRIFPVQKSVFRRRGKRHISACRSRSRRFGPFGWDAGRRGRDTQRGLCFDRRDKRANPARYTLRSGYKAVCSLPCSYLLFCAAFSAETCAGCQSRTALSAIRCPQFRAALLTKLHSL